jgi:CRP-like cAMP-binding protein
VRDQRLTSICADRRCSRAALRTQPAISDRFIAHILARNSRLEAELTNQLLNGCEQRLAHTLLALAGCDEHHPSRRALPDVSQRIIAEMVGTTRSHVNHFMGKFRKLGFLEDDHGVLQVMPSLLHIVSGELRGVGEQR